MEKERGAQNKLCAARPSVPAGRLPHTNTHLSDFDLAPVFPAGMALSDAFDHAGVPMAPAQPEGKRGREDAGPLGAMKKLKLRAHNPEG